MKMKMICAWPLLFIQLAANVNKYVNIYNFVKVTSLFKLTLYLNRLFLFFALQTEVIWWEKDKGYLCR